MSPAAAAPGMTGFSGSRFLLDLLGRDPPAALARLHEQVEWTVPGDPRFGGGVHRGRDAVLEFFASVQDLFPAGLRVDAHREWPGPNGCVVEAVLVGEASTGKAYRNRYAFVFEEDGGQVRRVREYTDTAYAEAILQRP